MDRPDGERPEEPEGVDWRSPRWRESDEAQGETERAHRFRGDSSPVERGAIDRDGSIAGGPNAPDPKRDGGPARNVPAEPEPGAGA